MLPRGSLGPIGDIFEFYSPDPPSFGWGGKASPDLQWKHIQFINTEGNLMFRVISEASVMTDSSHNSWNMSPIRSIFKGFPISHAQTFI